MKKILSVAVFLILLTSLAVDIPRTYACSCIMPEPPLVSMEKSDAVFAGRVTNIVPPANMMTTLDENKITFDVSTYWKGIDRNPVQIFSAMSSASCGYEFEEGKEYLVYAHESDGKLVTGLCTRTALLADATEDLKALGEGMVIEPSNVDNEPIDNTTFVVGAVALAAIGVGAYYFIGVKRK